MGPNFKNLKRIMYEKSMLNIYIILPSSFVLLYIVISSISDFNIYNLTTFQNHKIEIGLTIAGIMLTIMGLFVSLPNTPFRKNMKKFGHDRIMNRTLLIGTLSSLFLVAISVIEIFSLIQSIMFIFAISEALIATVWMYKTLKYFN